MITKNELLDYLKDYSNFSEQQKSDVVSFITSNDEVLLAIAADSKCKNICRQIPAIAEFYKSKILTDKNFVNQLDSSMRNNLLISIPALKQQFDEQNSPSMDIDSPTYLVNNLSNLQVKNPPSFFNRNKTKLEDLTSFKGKSRPISKPNYQR